MLPPPHAAVVPEVRHRGAYGALMTLFAGACLSAARVGRRVGVRDDLPHLQGRYPACQEVKAMLLPCAQRSCLFSLPERVKNVSHDAYCARVVKSMVKLDNHGRGPCILFSSPFISLVLATRGHGLGGARFATEAPVGHRRGLHYRTPEHDYQQFSRGNVVGNSP